GSWAPSINASRTLRDDAFQRYFSSLLMPSAKDLNRGETRRFDLLSMGVGAILGFTISAIETECLYRELFFVLPIRIIDTLIASF
ncbi:hypothetical protein SB861_53850, partial [Paraburkholderia sp. SIMBA_049]